jgi:hypothetical protein
MALVLSLQVGELVTLNFTLKAEEFVYVWEVTLPELVLPSPKSQLNIEEDVVPVLVLRKLTFPPPSWAVVKDAATLQTVGVTITAEEESEQILPFKTERKTL